MPKSVFYSFKFDRDYWRVNNLKNIGALEQQPIFNPNDWETIKRKGDAAIKNWIDEQMKYKRAVIVLIGATTASSRWVDYEIRKAWNGNYPLVGVRIHGLKDQHQRTDVAGRNPFADVTLQDGRTLDQIVRVHDPVGRDSKAVHASIRENLETWVDQAVRKG